MLRTQAAISSNKSALFTVVGVEEGDESEISIYATSPNDAKIYLSKIYPNLEIICVFPK